MDALLKGWQYKRDKLSTARAPVARYALDLVLIVWFREGRAVGVAAITAPGVGPDSISEQRLGELVTLIGRTPDPSKMKRREQGLIEFETGNCNDDPRAK